MLRVLCLSDLHMCFGYDDEDSIKAKWIGTLLKAHNPDVTVISGDVHESIPEFWRFNPFTDLERKFGGRRVVFVLGNHEFYNRTVHDTMDWYSKNAGIAASESVHCLDLGGSFSVGSDGGGVVTFLGNFLGYDGSTRTLEGQRLEDWAHGGWADKLIHNYAGEYMAHTKRLQGEIVQDLGRAVGTTVLVTHTVPHVTLNGHLEKDTAAGGNEFNAYSGLSDFLERHSFDYSISGHTHSRAMGKVINGCRCVNVGNDYRSPWMHHVLEVD